MSSHDATSRVKWLWHHLHNKPGGSWLFSRMLKWVNPYSGAIRAEVLELGNGHAKLILKQRKAIMNHLGSIHALALANLGELTSGLALVYGMKPETRGIPIKLSVEFMKKARGVLTAVSDFSIPEVTGDREYQVNCDIRDGDHELVAVTTVTWQLGLRQEK